MLLNNEQLLFVHYLFVQVINWFCILLNYIRSIISNLISILKIHRIISPLLLCFCIKDDPDGLRYRIVRRKAFEDILDGEFDDTTFEGLFYIGKSFV